MAKRARPARGKVEKVIGVPLTAEEVERFYAFMPKHLRTPASWGRQLFFEGLDRLEAQSAKSKGKAA